jgi:hypothetical protein
MDIIYSHRPTTRQIDLSVCLPERLDSRRHGRRRLLGLLRRTGHWGWEGECQRPSK